MMKVVATGEEQKNSIKMLYDRQKLQGGSLIKVPPDTSEMGAREINEWMTRWLRTEQKIASTPDPSHGSDRHERQDRRNPPQRWHREVGVEESEYESDAEIHQVGKGGRRPPTPPKASGVKETKAEAEAPKESPPSAGSGPSACATCGHSASEAPSGKGDGVHSWPPQSWGGRGYGPSGKGTWNGSWSSGKGTSQWVSPEASKGELSSKGKGKGDSKGKGKGEKGDGKGGSKGDGKGKGKNGGRGKGIGAVEAWEEE